MLAIRLDYHVVGVRYVTLVVFAIPSRVDGHNQVHGVTSGATRTNIILSTDNYRRPVPQITGDRLYPLCPRA
jgi:hypothetical protein